MQLTIAIATLFASLFLLFSTAGKTVPGIAIVASIIEVVLGMGYLHSPLSFFHTWLILSLGLAIPGLIIWWKGGSKTALTCSTFVASIGILQLLSVSVHGGLRLIP